MTPADGRHRSMTVLSIYALCRTSISEIEVVLTQSFAVGGTAHPKMLSANSADFDSMNC
ncbi:hypothetical protein RA210_U430007 [Rubrivivax sp. A210]|nr:hypothetical protein RA210_U430007 [Rubrivivax sp. A210]